MSSVNRSYNEQIDCYAACINYKKQPPMVKRKIDRLIDSVGGGNAPALREYMTTDADFRYVCSHFYISDSTLDRLRKRFYSQW